MTTNQAHLELRSTGFYWRRRVPAAAKNRSKPQFFCFPLRTHVPRDAAELARRLTAVSEICFKAEQQMPPEFMTEILVTYAQMEIELSDRLRALTGPRTREAGEAALALEGAARASLRDAIFLCDKSPALQPIRDTAERLGLVLDEAEDDFAILAEKMVRTMIAVSEERERRAQGIYNEQDANLAEALRRMSVPNMPSAGEAPRRSLEQATPSTASPTQKPIVSKEPASSKEEQELTSAATDEQSDRREILQQPEMPHEDVVKTAEPALITIHNVNGRSVKVRTDHLEPVRILDGTDPRVLDLWDEWFDDKMAGLTFKGAYIRDDEGKGARFGKSADTIRSTRKIVSDVFGDIRLSQTTSELWSKFNDLLLELPNNQGRSANLRHLTCREFIEHERAEEGKRLLKAEQRINKEGLSGEEAEAIREQARTKVISPRTFQRHLKYLSSPLNHAVEKGLISHNPFKPFVLGEEMIDEMRASLPETKRKTWTSDELAVLLSTEKWHSADTRIDDPVYWVPLIARLLGLRSEEILQLKPENVRCDNGIHFLDIERGTGQSIKSNNARRFVPVHSQLIELGFLELVEQQKRLGKTRIFSQVARSKCSSQNYTKTFTKKLTYYRKTRKAYASRQDLHSMRTTFNAECIGRSVPDTARRYLMGHRNDDVGITNYLPEGFPLATLKQYIEQERLNLGMVTKRFGAVAQELTAPRLATQNGVALSA